MITKSLLYIINFYGSPPLNYFEKYIKETKSAHITILKLPSVRTSKFRLIIDAFIKDEQDKRHNFHLNVLLPLPYFVLFILQYAINAILALYLLRKIKRKKFDIGIGETNFGSAVCYILRKLRVLKFSVYFNGDILPDPSSSPKCFFLPNPTRFHFICKFIDTIFLKLQERLRKLGYLNDAVWYGNETIKKWDEKRGFKSKSHFVADPILIDFNEYIKYKKTKKNKDMICYIGRIDEYVGLDVIISSLLLVKKKIPTINLQVVGGSGIILEKYKKLVEKLNLSKNVTFYGFLPKMEDAFSIMSKCALGVALYKPTPDNVSMFSQPAKPKEYIKVGLPVLVTKNGPPIGKEIVSYRAGLDSLYDQNDASRAIVKALTDDKYYLSLQKGVEDYAKKNHYFNTIKKVWQKIISYEIR